MAAASVALVAAAAIALTQRTGERPEPAFLTLDEARSPGRGVTTFVWSPPANTAPLGPELSFPLGTVGARLSAIPDALLNDPPAARYQQPVEVRGRAGLATSDGPLVLAWSEDGYWYELSSPRLTIQQLIDLASALE